MTFVNQRLLDKLKASSRVTCSDLLDGIFWSMIMAGINPHRFSLAGAFESAFAVKFYGPSVSQEQVLVVLP